MIGNKINTVNTQETEVTASRLPSLASRGRLEVNPKMIIDNY